MHIAVLTWWTGSEREVSLRSASAVEKALETLWYSYQVYDYPEDIDGLLSDYKKISFVFLMIHGSDGEDGKLAGLLDGLWLTYQCAPREVLGLTINKYLTKLIRKEKGIPVAKDRLVNLDSTIPNYEGPCVIKALCEGSSIGVWVCKNESSFLQSIKEAKPYGELLIEEFLEWSECTASLLNIDGKLTALPLIEIIAPEGKEFDYENKYNNLTQEICPARFKPELTKQIQDIALKAYEAVACKKYARIDIIVTTEWPRCLEINTIPGFTDASLFPKAARAHGIEFTELIKILINSSNV